MKQISTELKGEINSSTIVVEDFNILLSMKGRTSPQDITFLLLIIHETFYQ